MYIKLAFAALAGSQLAAAAVSFGPNGPEFRHRLVIPSDAGPWTEAQWSSWSPWSGEKNGVDGKKKKEGAHHHHKHYKHHHYKADHKKDHATTHPEEDHKGAHKKHGKHHHHHHHKADHRKDRPEEHHGHKTGAHKKHGKHHHHHHHHIKAHHKIAAALGRLVGHGPKLSHPHGSSEHRHAGHSSPNSEYRVNKYAQMVVKHHNYHRANHSAPPIQWDRDLASSARTIAASCIYAHNTGVDGGGYGQNIAAGTTTDQISVVISDLFYNGEVNWFTGYGQANPDMTNFEHWGHFSQVVWKDTTTVGCATQFCPGGLANTGYNVQPYFTVCNYKGPGNFGGEYGANIGEPLGNATIHGVNHL